MHDSSMRSSAGNDPNISGLPGNDLVIDLVNGGTCNLQCDLDLRMIAGIGF